MTLTIKFSAGHLQASVFHSISNPKLPKEGITNDAKYSFIYLVLSSTGTNFISLDS